MIIYLAGGMRSDWQSEVILSLPQHQFLDPSKHGLKHEKDYTKWDLQAVAKSDLVLAYMEHDNPSGQGLALEVGYATALRIPTVYVEDPGVPHSRYFGMVRACAAYCLTDLSQALSLLNGAQTFECPTL